MSTNEIAHIKSFYLEYENLIATANYKQVAERYSQQGAILTTYGTTKVLSQEEVRSFYAKIPSPACDFRFDDLQIELLNDTAAMVNAIMHCQLKDQPEVAKLMYTAVLLKTPNGWKIRHEHESPVFETFKNMLKKMDEQMKSINQ